MLSRFQNKEGFTLIELMIVVAIIGILAAIAIPNFLTMQLKAKRSELPMNLAGISTAEGAYFQEFGLYLAATVYPVGTPSTQKMTWATGTAAGGYDTIGYAPQGAVFGQYTTTTVDVGAPTFTAVGNCDVDADTVVATYEATNLLRPELKSAANVY